MPRKEKLEAYPFLGEIRHPKKRAFLVAYCECFNLTEAGQRIGIHRNSHYYWLAHDEAYQEAFDEAKIVGGETLEAECVRRAFRGCPRQKFWQGQPILVPCDPDHPLAMGLEGGGHVCPYVEHEFSDTLAIFLLKGAMPEKYRERYELRDPDGKVAADLAKVVHAMATRKAAAGLGDGPPADGPDSNREPSSEAS
jgi:hypothetical protein